MNDYKLGTLLKQIRTSKHITQKQLAKGIIGVRHLIKLENGETLPRIDNLQRLSARLGVDIFSYIEYTTYENMIEVHEFFSELERLYNLKDRNELEKLIRSDIADSILLPEHNKRLDWYRIYLSAYRNNEYEKGCNDLILLLSNWFKCDADINIILNQLLEKDDFRILNSVAKLMNKMGKTNKSKELYTELIAKLTATNFLPFPDIVLPITFNLTNLLYDNHEYDLCLHYCQLGKQIAIEHSKLNYLGDFCCQLGNCYEKLGDKEKSLSHYKNFLFSYEIQGLDDKVTVYKEQLMKQYGDVF